MPDETSDAELLRRFKDAISGMEMADLREAGERLLDIGGAAGQPPPRPRLRRPPREAPAVYRIRVDLDDANPPISRVLDVRSDLTLDMVHQVLQAAFGWTDSHLHRFALGGGPFDLGSEWFLCPFDVDEGEDEGEPASSIRLDETLQEHGDVLRYVYDYGDSWELTLRLDEVLAAGPTTPMAVCVDGRRAAPPEDCGGITDAAELAEVIEDPAHFDTADVNAALRDPFFALQERGIAPRLVQMIQQLRFSDGFDDLVDQLVTLSSPAVDPPVEAKRSALRAVDWFLERGADGGLELTSAGYLKPKDVEAACAMLPTMAGWIGKNNREVLAHPLLAFRKHLQTMGLLRKYKGRLLTTKAGDRLRDAPGDLWDHIAQRLVPAKRAFDQDASLLILAVAATSSTGDVSRDHMARALYQLGWRHSDGSPVDAYDLSFMEPSPYDILWNLTDQPPQRGDHHQLSPAAIALARAAIISNKYSP